MIRPVRSARADPPYNQHALFGTGCPPIISTPCLAQAESPYKQHALKGQKLLAQGNALGYHERKPVAL